MINCHNIYASLSIIVYIIITTCLSSIYAWDNSVVNTVQLHDDLNVYQALWSNRRVLVAETHVENIKTVTINEQKITFFPKESILEKHFIETAFEHKHDEIGDGNYYHLIERHKVMAHMGHKQLGSKLAYSYTNPKPEYHDIKGMIAFVADGSVHIVHTKRENGFIIQNGMRIQRDHTNHEAHRHSKHINGHLYNDIGGSTEL